MQTLTINRTDYSEIFNYAEELYDISWNRCNDLFFDTFLEYKSINDIDLYELLQYTEYTDNLVIPDIKDYMNSITTDYIEDQNDDVVAAIILIKYMLKNNVEEMEVDNR